MAQPLDYVEYLTKEIGARPAGTEEEQQAALYIADEFQKAAGFPAAIEEFTSSSNLEGYRAILAMITIVVSVLAMLFNILTAPAFILAVVSAVIYALEVFDHPVISRFLARGASQNVVAKYQPHGETDEGKRGARTRKIVLVAHYDTGKVTPGIIRRVEGMGLPLGTICLGGMIAAAFFLLLRIFVGGTGGAGLIFINIVTIIAIIIVALPIVKAILYRTAPYNEGANNNATGVAALIEVASRINSGSVSEADLADADGVAIHGEDAARASGLIASDTDLTYEVEPNIPMLDEDASEEDRLLAAKAAIAALTGQHIEQRVYAQVSTERTHASAQKGIDNATPAAEEAAQVASEVVKASAPAVEAVATVASAEQAAEVATASRTSMPDPSETGGFENAPSWFIAAQRNAKRSESNEPIQRSRYTEAISAAERELAERERAREEEERERRALELRERHEATRAAISNEQSAKEQPSIQFAPIVVDDFDNAPQIQLDPIDAPADGGSTVVSVPLGATAEATESAQAESPATPAHEQVLVEKAIEESTERVAEEAAEEPAEASIEDQADAETASAKPESNEDVAAEESAQPVEAAELADPSQTVAYIPDHLRELLQKHAEETESEQDIAALESEGAAAVANALAANGEAEDLVVSTDQAIEAEEKPADSRLANLPSIGQEAKGEPQVEENANPSRSGLFRMLRSDVPSLSGAVKPVQEETKPKVRLSRNDVPSLSGIMNPVKADDQAAANAAEEAPSEKPSTRASLGQGDVPEVAPLSGAKDAAVDYSMEIPVSEELANAADEAENDIAQDQDASATSERETGSTRRSSRSSRPSVRSNEAGKVDMPKSRAGGFFSRLRRKNGNNLEETPQEWLDVDKDFEAREVGRERGNWESFRQDDDIDEAYDNREWEGGAFSRVRLGHVNMRSGAEETADEPEELIETTEDRELNEEIEQIYHFRNPLYDSEIWFVAIGSDTELHDGAKAFVEEHKHELRGAMFVEVESLGLGELCYATEEGQFRRIKASSRIKRFTRDATEATGIALGKVSTRADSITTTIQKAGFQALHLMGIEDGLPALKGSADDILENVDDLTFEENINYLMELMKQQ